MSPQARFRRGLLKCLYSWHCHSRTLKKTADWYFGKTYSSFYCNSRKLKAFLTDCRFIETDEPSGISGMLFIMSFVGAFMITSLIKFRSSSRASPRILTNASASSSSGYSPNRSRYAIFSKSNSPSQGSFFRVSTELFLCCASSSELRKPVFPALPLSLRQEPSP